MSPSRPRVAACALAVAVVASSGLVAAPAAGQPASAFRFWGYYQQADGQWQFAQTGSDATNPADGSVEGWRFATAGVTDARFPRATPSFEDLCAQTDAADGSKRVAVVLDFGRAADGAEGAQPPEPRGECAVVPQDATGSDVLAAVAQVRVEGGLTCAIDGYPESGCGEAVDEVSAAAQAADEPMELAAPADAADDTAADAAAGPTDDAADDAEEAGSNTGTWIAVAVLAVLALAGAAAWWRRRATTD